LPQERLQKFLARAGVASRRAAEGLISAGRVKVNGAVISAMGSRVDTEKDVVTVDGKPARVASTHTYLLLNKPPGVLTTLSDPQGRPTVKSLLHGVTARVFPIGRLDFDAEGALLLTDDGELAQRLTHPKYQVPRTYLALVKGVPTDADLKRLLTGVRLEDGPAQAAVAERFEKVGDETWIKLVVHEGRQHLVKKLCAAIGFPVARLFRPSHAGLALGNLPPGKFRALSEEEVQSVMRFSRSESLPALDAPAAPLVLPGLRIEFQELGRSEPKAPRRSENKPPPGGPHKAPRRP
jgi:23S rRNA pseudouridine2605 synthase